MDRCVFFNHSLLDKSNIHSPLPYSTVPAITIPLCLLLVHRHPQPVDDCPCFEDAIAFVSVVLGEFLSRWLMSLTQFDERYFVRVMPGKPTGGSWAEVGTWWSVALAKMVIGTSFTLHQISSFSEELSMESDRLKLKYLLLLSDMRYETIQVS